MSNDISEKVLNTQSTISLKVNAHISPTPIEPYISPEKANNPIELTKKSSDIIADHTPVANNKHNLEMPKNDEKLNGIDFDTKRKKNEIGTLAPSGNSVKIKNLNKHSFVFKEYLLEKKVYNSKRFSFQISVEDMLVSSECGAGAVVAIGNGSVWYFLCATKRDVLELWTVGRTCKKYKTATYNSNSFPFVLKIEVDQELHKIICFYNNDICIDFDIIASSAVDLSFYKNVAFGTSTMDGHLSEATFSTPSITIEN